MPNYTYSNGTEYFERFFNYGKAPEEIDGFKKIIRYPDMVKFKGEGWTLGHVGYNGKPWATWSKVEQAIKGTQWDSDLKPQYDHKKLK